MIFQYEMNLALRFAEFELLRNAMYTDPNDQSVWMYHRWLVGTGNVSSMKMLTVLRYDCRWQ